MLPGYVFRHTDGDPKDWVAFRPQGWERSKQWKSGPPEESDLTDEKTRHGMCLIYLPADEFLRLPALGPAGEP